MLMTDPWGLKSPRNENSLILWAGIALGLFFQPVEQCTIAGMVGLCPGGQAGSPLRFDAAREGREQGPEWSEHRAERGPLVSV